MLVSGRVNFPALAIRKKGHDEFRRPLAPFCIPLCQSEKTLSLHSVKYWLAGWLTGNTYIIYMYIHYWFVIVSL